MMSAQGFDMAQLLFQLSVWALPLLLAITVHEAAHAWAALRLGDKTAFLLGRVTLNPVKHIDPIGTIILPLLLLITSSPLMFAWAKPVPINLRNLKHYHRDQALIAAAGPLSNIMLAILWAATIKVIFLISPATTKHGPWVWLYENAHRGLIINCLLAVFNALPIPPLDGSKILFAILPIKLRSTITWMEDYGFYIILILILTGVLTPLILTLTRALMSGISMILGL
jgi:Zn-dependent protease